MRLYIADDDSNSFACKFVEGPGSSVVNVTANDGASSGNFGDDPHSVTVNNVAPTATFNAPASVNEGSNINISLTDVVDPGTADTHEFRFSCDGGTTWTAWSTDSTHACSTTDNGTRSVKGEVRDDDGGASTYSASVTVNNVAPTATFNAPASVNEGSNINIVADRVVDPGTADTARVPLQLRRRHHLDRLEHRQHPRLLDDRQRHPQRQGRGPRRRRWREHLQRQRHRQQRRSDRDLQCAGLGQRGLEHQHLR